MNRKKLATVVVIVVAAAGAILPLTLAQAKQGTNPRYKSAMNIKQPAKTDVLSLETIHAQHIPRLMTSIDEARKAVTAGDKKTALAELRKAREILVVIQQSLATYVKPKFANVRCPIMGSPIHLDNISKNLIREHKGEKVAFCCAGCPAAWDKLSDAQKQLKLAKVKP